MLRRQQAEAIIAARQKIVEGAVGMVDRALYPLSEKKLVQLDEERKAAMVSNLMVVLCGEQQVNPIVNAGTLTSECATPTDGPGGDHDPTTLMARKQFLLRIDPELWKELERWAADDLRSVNAQIEWLLREAVRRRKGSQRRSAAWRVTRSTTTRAVRPTTMRATG